MHSGLIGPFGTHDDGPGVSSNVIVQPLREVGPVGRGLYGVDVILEARQAADTVLNVHAGHGSRAMLLEVGWIATMDCKSIQAAGWW